MVKSEIIYFWSPYIFSGTPILADIQVGLLYPLNLLLIPFSNTSIDRMYWLVEMQAIFHLFLGNLFMYFLMRYLKVSHFSSLFSAVAFTLSPFLILNLKALTIAESAIWLPIIFLFFHRALHEKKLKDSIVAGLFLAMSFLAGSPQASYIIILFLLSYFIYFLIAKKTANINLLSKKFYFFTLKNIALVLPFFLVSFGVAAIIFLPYLEANKYAFDIGSSFLFSSSLSLNPAQFLITSFLPHFFGGQSIEAPYFGEGNYWSMTAGYAGIITLFLALISFIFLKKSKEIKFFFMAALLSLVLAFGHYFFVYYLAYLTLPGLKMFRVPARFLFLYGFSLIIAAGYGLDLLLDKNNLEKIRLFFAQKIKFIISITIIFLTLISAIWAVFSVFEIDKSVIHVFYKNIAADAAVLVFLISSLLILTKKYLEEKIAVKTFQVAILSLLAIDLFFFGFDFNNGSLNPNNFFKKTEEISYLEKQNKENARIIFDNNLSNKPNTALIHKFQTTAGYNPRTVMYDYQKFLWDVKNDKDYYFSELTGNLKLTPSLNRLKLLNACYILAGEQNGSDKKYSY